MAQPIVVDDVYLAAVSGCESSIRVMLADKPSWTMALLRVALHDSLEYDKNTKTGMHVYDAAWMLRTTVPCEGNGVLGEKRGPGRVGWSPPAGGANGSIRADRELKHAANEGLAEVVKELDLLREKHAPITFADVVQLSGFVAAEALGAGRIEFTPGRRDSKAGARTGLRPPLPTRHLNTDCRSCRSRSPRAACRPLPG